MPSTWGATASNGLITFDAMRDAVSNYVFDSKVDLPSIPSGTEIVTKADASTYLWLDVYSSPWSNYADNRCPPKSAFSVLNLCTIVEISISDILSSTGNTSYPDGTVYLVTADGTYSYTSPGSYQICTRPSTLGPNFSMYFYANDNIDYNVISTVTFYPNTVSCTVSGCTGGSYSMQYDAFTCPCTGGSTVTVYVDTPPVWTVGTRFKNASGTDVFDGRYTYAGKCYRVQPVTTYFWTNGKMFTTTVSQVTSVTNC